jgi:hypothetical protein
MSVGCGIAISNNENPAPVPEISYADTEIRMRAEIRAAS